MNDFAADLTHWQRLHGRNALPWQGGNAYQVWISEIMLQQTQVATVIPYYRRFLAAFPTVTTLAASSEDQVLAHWSGLGYYTRARNLYRAAQHIMQRHTGNFPHSYDSIVALPGIGRSTAAAICALALKQRHAILDGNVKRVLARYHAVKSYPGEKKTEALLWQHAEALLPAQDIAAYTQGLMDLGALVCTRSKPLCSACPVQRNCAAYQQGITAQLPAPRPRKALPERHSTFILLLNGNDILLERRPATGIWGGLWCPPQVENIKDAGTYCAQHYGADAQHARMLPVFIHTFTHFKLHITPWRLQVQRKHTQVAEPGQIWLAVEDALQAAIPAPVRKLLLGLQAQ